jgi:hypothetical protein
MNPDLGKLLTDILISIDAIEMHLQNIPTLSVYKNDLKTMDAVERRL